MDTAKFAFVEKDFPALIRTISADAAARWGRMNAQQMIEHVAGFFKVSTQQIHFPLVTPVEHLPKFKEFLLSEKEFRENTKAPVLPEEPLPLRFATLIEAKDDLEKQVSLFIVRFNSREIVLSQHPVFGDLNFEEWILLHYKHTRHHAKQFGLL